MAKKYTLKQLQDMQKELQEAIDKESAVQQTTPLQAEPPVPVPAAEPLREVKKHSGLKWRDKWKMRKRPSLSFLVTIIHSNGTSKTFIVATDEETFTYGKRHYYLRFEDNVFDLSHGQYHLFYHEDHAVPLQVDVEMIEDPDAPKGKERAFWAVRPHNLKPVIDMEYVKALTAIELSKYIKLTLLIAAGALIASGVNLYLTLQPVK